MKEAVAKALLAELQRNNKSARVFWDALWQLQMCYAYGNQWSWIADGIGNLDVRFLQQQVDPNRRDIRVTLNRILPDIRKMAAALAPNRIEARCEARGASPSHMSIKYASDSILKKHLTKIEALEWLREKEEWRLILGSVVIRRTLAQRGDPKRVREKQGDQDELLLRTLENGWAVCPPWEFLRDPSANTLRPDRDEQIFCHEKARTVEWVQQNYGVKVETQSTMGNLASYQQRLMLSEGRGGMSQDSKQPGVVVSECFYKTGENNEWSHRLIAWSDPSDDEAEIHVIRFGKNPFYGLPFEIYPFDTRAGWPWGRGVPAIQMAGQDLANIVYSWLARLVNEGSGQLLIQKDTVEDPQRQLSNRMDEPIFYTRNSQYDNPPTRLAPPQIGGPIAEMLTTSTEFMDRSLNMSAVQRGEAVKRGEAAKAYKVRLEEANTTLEFRRIDDGVRHERLLYGTLVDVVKLSRLDQIRKLVGDAITDEMIRAVKRKPIVESISKVNILSVMLRPKTQDEMKESYIGLHDAQMIGDVDARWEMMLRGEPLDTGMYQAYQKQNLEIDQILHGQEAPVRMEENHTYHIRTVREFLDSPGAYGLDPEQIEALEAHSLDHRMWEQELLMGGGAMGAPASNPAAGMPSPPAGAVGATGPGPAPVAPAMSVM